MSSNYEEKIKEINGLIYLNRNVIWCKAELIESMKDRSCCNKEEEAIDQFLRAPSDLNIRREMITLFLANSLATDHTPESFLFDELVDAKWTAVNLDECEGIINELILVSEIQHKEVIQEYEFFGDTHFVNYQRLKEDYLTGLFDLETVQFFTNSSTQEIKENEALYPAVVGIDNRKIGLLWLM